MAIEQITTTGIDALVEYLNKNGETDESKLASELKVGEKVIEDWANVLEKASIVKINYRVGKMFVAPLVISSADVQTFKSTVEVKKQTVETELAAQMNLMQEFDRRISNLSKIASTADLTFKKNAGSIKRDLDELEKIRREVEKHYNGIKVEKDRVDKTSETLETEMHALEEIANKIQGFSAGQADVKSVMDDIRGKMRRYDETVKALERDYEKMVNEKKGSLRQLHDSIYSEMKSLEDAIERQGRQLNENSRLEKYAKKESARLKTQAEKDRIVILNNIAKVKQNIDSIFPLAEKRVHSATESMNELKKGFGEIANVSDQLAALKSQLEEIKKEHDSVMKEAQQIEGELKTADFLKKSDTEKGLTIAEVRKKTAKLGERSKNLDTKLNETKANLDSLSKAAPGEE